ncbi:uncharacterized protein B0I36DRAFT_429504 [Microdochium trichocladiopsis]|uniref:Protein SKT5 n=1 Tax=Microdochium trichocladiopsis TaxID=1682393 RepID=A0A9P8YC69_9PEZI|nr:uncharacterized protein B0I36DRAFT_429504 [Microdochium trichocladiopsis]KAH7035364.1 hypothetical protein B0I36DRAFT_429504 [Microdochium trichocladiopsis]
MASVTANSPPATAASPSSPVRSLHRKPVSPPRAIPNNMPGNIRMAPVSPVRLNFQPDSRALGSDPSFQQQRVSMYLDDHIHDASDAPVTSQQPQARAPSHAHSSTLPKQRQAPRVELEKTLPPGSEHSDIPGQIGKSTASTVNGQGAGEQDRLSRESDTTSTSQVETSQASSVETSHSSVSAGPQEKSGSQTGSLKDPILEEVSVPQLQYHHQAFMPRVASVPLEMHSRNSSNTDLGDPGINRHLTPNSNIRRSSMPRPQSSYSLLSDGGPRGKSPLAARRSPDVRPQSYAELLNVPYPQPAPAPITFDNSQLRNNVGTNASLLSAQKTLEMYRQNVKKTNDFSIQYSFAVFLISTAQEQGLSRSEPARRKGSAKPDTPEIAESSPTELVREAKAILTKLASAGYPFAQYYLADGYASGIFNKGKEDPNSAFPLFVLAAKHGHAESAYRAGLCYEFGWGCRSDPTKAIQFLRTAASKNHPGAMTRLGKACLSGDLGESRYREGLKWLKRASEAADTIYNAAPYHLGTLYETGYGEDIFKDEGYAAELFTQAAELGHPEASFRMGDAYEHGTLSCPRDPALSVHFYTGAADRGHPGAMMGLCAWYMVGAEPVLEKDEEEAYEWARRSAELGFVKAQYAVGYFTEMGIGCRRDILEANVWYVKAADAGDERAKQRLAVIREAVSGGGPRGVPMDVAPPRNAKMKKNQSKDDKDCIVM